MRVLAKESLMRYALSLGLLGALVVACAGGQRAVPAAGGAPLQYSMRAGSSGAQAQLAIVAPTLNAPTSPTAPQTQPTNFQIAVTAVDAAGNAVRRATNATPIVVRVYGPAGTVSLPNASSPAPVPSATVGSTGVATFHYGGTYFANPMTVTAVAGNASMTAQIFQTNTPPPTVCTNLTSTKSLEVNEPNALAFKRGGFFIHASIGSRRFSRSIGMQLDTGSTGVLIAKPLLSSAQLSAMVGPGQAGEETLLPSHITERGNYYLARVTLFDRSQRRLGTTVPMEVLVLTQKCQHGTCTPDTSTSYMGVGFGRPTPPPTSGYLKAPLENAFLQLDKIVEGTMHPGFILSSKSLRIGLNARNASNFAFTSLTPFAGRPGDWNGPPACVAFGGAYQCGSMLLDIGISTMFIGANVPSSFSSISIAAPTSTNPALAYSFPYPVPAGATPPAPNPNAAQPIDFTRPPATPFINTGRDALAAATYLYDAACGRVGFQPPT